MSNNIGKCCQIRYFGQEFKADSIHPSISWCSSIREIRQLDVYFVKRNGLYYGSDQFIVLRIQLSDSSFSMELIKRVILEILLKDPHNCMCR